MLPEVLMGVNANNDGEDGAAEVATAMGVAPLAGVKDSRVSVLEGVALRLVGGGGG